MQFRWSMVAQMCRQPYPLGFSVLGPIITLACLVPCYIFIGSLVTPIRAVHAPVLPLDRLFPLSPVWSVIYGSHLILVLLPFLVVRQTELVRRTVLAYLLVWTASLLCFLLYPTAAPRPANVSGVGFFVWLLGIIYAADPPYNCLPSLHVAHTLVSAFACHHVHRGVGAGLGIWTLLIGQSALHTKQHYVLDVVGGVLLAIGSYWVFLRRRPREAVPEFDRCVAPYVALMFVGAYGLTLAGFWLSYRLLVRP
jgi:membrane-associated phospholipid phosphatase